MSRISFPLAAAAIIMPSCAVILITSAFSLSSSKASLNETKMAEAYSCAYLAGQYAIMNRMPSLFPGTRAAPDYCEPFRVNAAKHGFANSAAP